MFRRCVIKSISVVLNSRMAPCCHLGCHKEAGRGPVLSLLIYTLPSGVKARVLLVVVGPNLGSLGRVFSREPISGFFHFLLHKWILPRGPSLWTPRQLSLIVPVLEGRGEGEGGETRGIEADDKYSTLVTHSRISDQRHSLGDHIYNERQRNQWKKENSRL